MINDNIIYDARGFHIFPGKSTYYFKFDSCFNCASKKVEVLLAVSGAQPLFIWNYLCLFCP